MSNNINYNERIRQFKAACEQIQNAVGNAKQEVIRRIFEKDDYASYLIAVLLDPFYVFGIGEKSLSKHVSEQPTEKFGDLLPLIWYLDRMRSSSNQVIANVQGFIASLDEDLRAFVSAYITKTLKLGVTGKTLNKALGRELIPELGCMLANKYFEHAAHVEGKEFYITEKLDGIRCLAVLTPDLPPAFYTRQGQIIDGLVEIEIELYDLAKEHGVNCILDGELIISDRDSYESKEQYKRTTKIVRREGGKKGITYHVFDITGDSMKDAPYYERRGVLNVVFHGLKHTKVLPVLYSGTDVSMISKFLDEQRILGHEGIMINIADALYQPKRTNDLLKCKVMQDCDLRVIGFNEGSGRFKGTLGSLIVEYKGGEVGVGSGFNDAMRREVWENQEKYLDRIATVQYFEETQDVTGKLSIRFPVFKEFREEGKEVSYN